MAGIAHSLAKVTPIPQRRLIVWVSTAATAAVLARGPRATPAWNVALLGLAFVAFAAVLGLEYRRPTLTLRDVLLPSALLLAVAVAYGPVASRDVWSYVAYGRTVSVHHASPYRFAPAAFPHDAMLRYVSPVWRKAPSVYGPAFTAVSALGMAVVGNHPLGARLFFQLLTVLAVATALWLIWRETHDHRAVAVIALNPLVAVSVVNGAHNDALVGLAVLGGVLLARHARPGLAGVVLALGVLVKISAVLPLVAVAVWLLWRPRGRRAAAALAVAAALLVVGGYALAGGRAALRPLEEARLHVSGASPWDPARAWLTETRVNQGERGRVAGLAARREISLLAGLAVAGVAAVIVTRRGREDSPALVAGGAALAYTLLGGYVLPWYAVWGLFTLALRWRDHLTWIALVQGALLELAYVPDPPRTGDGIFGGSMHNELVQAQVFLRQDVLPVLEVAAVALLIVLVLRRRGGVATA